jgi:hypothetical protein
VSDLRADVTNRFCPSDDCPQHDGLDCKDCALHKLLGQLDDHLELRDQIRDDIKHFQAEVLEHDKETRSKKKAKEQRYHAGQRDAYEHFVKHLKGYLE